MDAEGPKSLIQTVIDEHAVQSQAKDVNDIGHEDSSDEEDKNDSDSHFKRLWNRVDCELQYQEDSNSRNSCANQNTCDQ